MEAINVCKAHEEMKKKAALKEKKDTAERMLKMKQFDTSVIAQASGLSEDEVKKIEASMLVPA